MKWIKCKNEMPQPYTDVLVCSYFANDTHIHIDRITQFDDGSFGFRLERVFGKPIAWMKLPEYMEND